MKEKVIDRRIQKTKKSLTEALIHLILEKGYEKVTIQNILDKANVGRSTFYLHYESKEQLLLDGHNNLEVKMFEDENPLIEIDFIKLFHHIEENKMLAKALLGKRSGNIMTGFLKNKIAQKIKKRYGKNFGRTKAEQKILAFISEASGATVVSLIVSWIEDDMTFSAKEMADKAKKLISSMMDVSVY